VPPPVAAVAAAKGSCFELVMVKHGKAQKQAARGARLSAALRENLKRRKAQARARSQAPGQDEGARNTGTAPPEPDFRRNPSPD
jgi:uncharacterized protein involved in type VI secretion and phage assembly